MLGLEASSAPRWPRVDSDFVLIGMDEAIMDTQTQIRINEQYFGYGIRLY